MSPRNVAVITGATQRLGTALARRLAQAGVSLALVDGDAGALARLERELASNRIVVSTHVADPADPGAAADVATAALAVHGRVDQFYAAARADADRAFADLPAGEFDRVMAVVARTPIALVRALLPSLLAGGAGRVVVFAERSGLDATGAGAVDAAAHYALRGFASGLGNELALSGRGSVHVVYATATQPPDRVARAGIDAAASGRRRVIVGGAARALSWLDRAFPVAQSRLIGAAARLGARA